MFEAIKAKVAQRAANAEATKKDKAQRVQEEKSHRAAQREVERKSEESFLEKVRRGEALADFSRTPFRLLKSERPLVLVEEVNYYKYESQRAFKSRGASVRIAKGVWLRSSQGRSRPDDILVQDDSGTLGITSKHLYFNGKKRNFRVRLDKLVTIEPDETAFSITRDGATARPEIFGGVKGHFVVQILNAATQLH